MEVKKITVEMLQTRLCTVARAFGSELSLSARINGIDQVLTTENFQVDDYGTLEIKFDAASRLTDHLDLMVDEFKRIKSLHYDELTSGENASHNREVVGLCERAIANTHQHVPVIVQRDTALKDKETLLAVERQLLERLGEMARLSDIVCTWALEHNNLGEESPEVKAAAEALMDYVEAVRP